MSGSDSSQRIHEDGSDRGLPEPVTARWQLLRAGLQNIWEYDDQRFVFHHGRLLLRGRNESGKTKAIEVLLPFLLDADLSPQRLDPFGSTSRLMRWNLISDSNQEVSISIGYVWLELGRRGAQGSEFCTIGAGLRARRATTDVDAWYFVTDQRMDRELHLVRDRHLLVRARLEEAIGGAGAVFERKGDYRRQVNQQLFGMPQEQYGTLVDTLIQLRRPQLSKQLQPLELSRILTASLPPLDAGVIGSLAEGFERLDRHRGERDGFAGTLRAVRGFLKVYRDYAATVAKAHALELTRADSGYQRERGVLREAEEARAQAGQRHQALADTIERLEHEDEAVSERLQTLRASDEYRAVRELDEAEQRARDHARQAAAAADRLAGEERRVQAAALRLQQAAGAVRAQEGQRDAASGAARELAREAALEQGHEAVDRQVAAADARAARGTLDSILARREQALVVLDGHAREVTRAEQVARRAGERLRDTDQRVRDARAALDEDEGAEAEACERFVAAVSDWLEALEVLRLAPETRQALLAARIDDMRDVAARAGDARRAAQAEQAALLDARVRELAQEIDAFQTERARLAAMTHQPPEPLPWRAPRPADRPGAPLYLLCDFRTGDQAAEVHAQAGLEAALEASGLLDAWITPDGTVLERDTFDILLTPAPRPGPSLADVLVPIEAGGVEQGVIERVLQTVGLVGGPPGGRGGPPARDDGPAGASCWVSTAGRWRVGPLHGAWHKNAPAYLGATARERERRRRLAELDLRIEELSARRHDTAHQRALVREQQERLQRELQCFPDLRPVVEARARVAAAQQQLGMAQRARDEAAAAGERARASLDAASRARDAAATELGLGHWAQALDALRQATRRYHAAAQDLLHEARELASLSRSCEERRQVVEDARQRTEQAREQAEGAAGQERRAAARAQALRQAVGATRDELLATLRETEERERVIRGSLERDRRQMAAVAQRVGETRGAAEAAARAVAEAEDRRKQAEARFRDFARGDTLAIVDIEVEGAPGDWSLTDALQAARRVDAATGKVEASAEAREKLENRVVGRQQELVRSLPPEVRVLPERVDGRLAYKAMLNGRMRGILELASELDEEVRSRDRLLDDQERKLFESFLSGETHEHLRTRLREAYELVGHMNAQLERCPTASGMQIRLRWDVDAGAPAGTREAIELLLRSSHLLSDANRDALQQFLQQRLEEAHVEDGAGTLHERMLVVLDYRSWFQFHVDFRAAEASWKPLTKKAHGAGSGGQKAVMLHLPLFAAAAAFYASASATAPRLIVLDEAFAGIDPKTRAQLMGLLVAFDLDFVMTSYEEWGFYEELDGLSTYHLARMPGMRGVYSDWFLWDGKQAVEMSTA